MEGSKMNSAHSIAAVAANSNLVSAALAAQNLTLSPLTTQTAALGSITSTRTSFAAAMNSYYANPTSNLITVAQRYMDALAALPSHTQRMVSTMISQAIAEFKLNNPSIKTFTDMPLAQAQVAKLGDIYIDTTMQRLLNLHWVAELLGKFKSTKVIPIQVYVDQDGKICAWDGQHTVVMLYIIITAAFNLNPSDVLIPVNIYPSHKKNEMRECFLDLNSSEGKRSLDLIDIWQQMIFGVRVDGSTNPSWVHAEKKQQLLEKWDLFVTHLKFNNADQPGAISRLQEIHKMDLTSLDWLLEYLSLTTNGARPVDEKEMVMMSNYFYRCKYDNIQVDSNYIAQLSAVALTNWHGDFSPNGPFWNRVASAYRNWHQSQPGNQFITPKVSKEPLHGMPFLLAQLNKSMPGYTVPRNISHSPFNPFLTDLF